MADFTALDVNEKNLFDEVTTASVAAAAASQTIDMTGFKELTLYVRNVDAAADAYVTINKGDGITSGIGDRVEICKHAYTSVIKISDTERHCVRSTGVITVELNDSAGTALAADILSDITLIAIRR